MQRRRFLSAAALVLATLMVLVPVGMPAASASPVSASSSGSAASAAAAPGGPAVASPPAGLVRPHSPSSVAPPAAAATAANSVGMLTYHNGPVMHHATNYAVYWQPPGTIMPNNYKALINRFFTDIGATPAYNVVQQYGDAAGPPGLDATFGGAWTDTRAFPAGKGTKTTPITAQDLLDYALNDALTANPTWVDDPNHEIFVFLPKGIYLGSGTARSFVDFCGFHFAYRLVGETTASHPVAAMPYVGTAPLSCDVLDQNNVPITPNGDADADSEINIVSHELFESVSDPASGTGGSTGWFYQDTSHENGDQCNFVIGPLDAQGGNTALNGHEYVMQAEWSNLAANPAAPSQANGCVLRSAMASSPVVSSNANPSVLSQSVTISATIAPSPVTKATGTVQFKDGSTVLTGGLPLVAGRASFTVSGLGTGNHAITAAYSGDANYQPGASAPMTQTVLPVLFSYPTDGQANVSTAIPFRWAGVAGAQAFVVTVGTAPNGADLVTSGVLPGTQTSFPVPVLPVGRTLYASLWLEINGIWSVQSIAFTAGPGFATFTYPVNNQINVDTAAQFAWTGVGGTHGYYLVVGTSLYGSDVLAAVVPPGQTTYSMSGLPAGKTLYALIFTEANGVWSRYEGATFTTAGAATFTYPTGDQVSVDTTQPFTWAAFAGAQQYLLAVGTKPFGSDLLAAAVPTTQLSYSMVGLPVGKTVYATLFTQVGGAWTRYQSISFTTAGAATLTNPVNGQFNVSTAQPFTWAAVGGAQQYLLAVGTTPYGTDVLATVVGASQLSYPMAALPKGRIFYAMLFTQVNGTWNRYQAISFGTLGG